MKRLILLLVAQFALSVLFAQDAAVVNNAQVVITSDTYFVTAGVTDNYMGYTNTGITTIDGAMKIAGAMTNAAGNAGVVVNNGGILLQNSDGVNATVRQEIQADAWHLISSPVATMSFSSQFTGAYVYEYNEMISVTEPWFNITSGFMQTDRGYLVQSPSESRTINFSGVLNNGDMLFPLGNQVDGFNLVGNPYSCAIDWDLVLKTNVENIFYVWDDTQGASGQYGTKNGDTEIFIAGSIIPANQGFIVKATAEGDFTIQNDDKVLNTEATFYKKSTLANLLRIRLSGENLVDETVIYFKESATDNYDAGIDADKFFGTATNLYSLTGEGTALAINATSTKVKTVALNFASETTGNYTLRVNEYTFTSDIIYIEDKLTGTVEMLTAGTEYTFSHASENIADRFVLHFNSTPTAIDNLNENSDITIFAAQGKLNVLNANEAIISVFDLLGKQIYSAKAKTNAEQIELPKGAIYIVKTVKNNQITTRKIMIND